MQRPLAARRLRNLERARRSRPQPPRQVQKVRGACVSDHDEHRVGGLRQHRESRRGEGEPDEIADQEARDERRRPAHAPTQGARHHGGHARARGGDRERIHETEDRQAVGGHIGKV